MTDPAARVVLTAAFVLCCAADTVAQSSPTPAAVAEHYGVGGVGALGWPGPVAAVRLSGPLATRAGLDLDIGRGRESREPTSVIAAQLRWLRRPRQPDGVSDYGIFGVLLMDDTRRVEVRFPGEAFGMTERRKRLSGQIGYGFDWQTANGTRVGIELAGGGVGDESLGVRAFLRVFAVWGRPVSPG